jgi:uncharacterized OB-fold protein
MTIVQASGRGTIYTWTTTYYAFAKEYSESLPYTVVTVSLDEGPRIYGRLVDESVDKNNLEGKAVRIEFVELPTATLPAFVLLD